MIDHGQIEGATIVHHLAHESRGRYRLAVIAHRNDARVLHRRNFGEGFTFTANGCCANRPDAHYSGRGGTFNDSAGDRSAIVYGLGVGHRADHGKTAPGGSACTRFDSFRKFLAGSRK